MCRNEASLMEAEREAGFYDKMLKKYLPILEHAEMLSLNNYGEVFVDKNCKRLIKNACAINKNLRLKILTNGIFSDEKRFKEYGIMDRVDSISVSVHAVTKKTYDSIVRNGDFEKVQRNVEWLAKMKEDGKINTVTINFVVQQKNYKEMIAFAKWAEKLKIECDFWEVRLDKDNAEIWDKNDSPEHLKDIAMGVCSYDISEYYKAAVHLSSHPEHKKLIKIVKNPIFKKKFCNINDLLFNDNTCT